MTITLRWGRLVELATGLLGNWVICYLFDYLLYPLVIYKLGLFRGGAVMSLLSLLTCLVMIWFYDWSQHDWLGIETLKSLKIYTGPSRFRRMLAWTLCRGDLLACIVLSLWYDPFITLIYLRDRSYSGLNQRDWGIFFASWAIGNGWWILACYFGVTMVEWICRLIF